MVAQFTPCPTLETKRLTIRAMTLDDAPAIFALRSNEQVGRYLDRNPYKTVREAEAYIVRINEGMARNEHISWCIVRKGERQPFGGICLWNLRENENMAEIGYEMLPAYEGHGYMREAAQAVIAYAFNVMKLGAVDGTPDPDNARSCRLLSACGFTRAEALKEVVNAKGAPCFLAVYVRGADDNNAEPIESRACHRHRTNEEDAI